MTQNKLLFAIFDMCQLGLVCVPEACCVSCAGRTIVEQVTALCDGGASLDTIKGCCFHVPAEGFCLAYGQIPHPKYGKVGLPTEEVGKLVCKCLKQNGIGYQWDGDPSKRIMLKGSAVSWGPDPSVN